LTLKGQKYEVRYHGNQQKYREWVNSLYGPNTISTICGWTTLQIGTEAGEESGYIYLDDPMESWELYKEPELELGLGHVGRVVKLRGGSYKLITGFCPGGAYPILLGDNYNRLTNGRYMDSVDGHTLDIIELLPKE